LYGYPYEVLKNWRTPPVLDTFHVIANAAILRRVGKHKAVVEDMLQIELHEEGISKE
jgi:hypothetical protein